MKMADIVIGMKLEDERTNEVFTVVEKNSKYKTVMLEAKDGSTKSTSISTINKHFAEVVDLEEIAIQEEETPTVSDCGNTNIKPEAPTFKEIADLFESGEINSEYITKFAAFIRSHK